MHQSHLEDLIVISWKLVDLGSDKFENYTKDISVPNQPYFDSVYVLKTCERILIAFLCSNSSVFPNFSTCQLCTAQKGCFEKDLLNINPFMFDESKKYRGIEAFRYLCSVAGSLDSSTIGEHEILGQFKNALVKEQETKILIGPLYDIILFAFKTGKKIHSSSGIPKGRVSILSNAEKIFYEWFGTIQEHKTSAPSIAIIGTGKMGRDAFKYFENKFNCMISVFSRNRSELITDEFQVEIKSYDLFLKDLTSNHFDVLLLCSSTNDPFLTENTLVNQKELLVFDLGIPKNANPEIKKISGITLYQMDELVKLSEENYSKRAQSLASAYEIIDEQVQIVELFFEKKAIDPFIKDLRIDLEKVAHRRLNDYTLNKELPVDFYKWFNNTVKELMHVSQQHLEKGIQQNDKSSTVEFDQGTSSLSMKSHQGSLNIQSTLEK